MQCIYHYAAQAKGQQKVKCLIQLQISNLLQLIPTAVA